MRLCKCGAIVAERCERCYPSTHAKTTKERGYGHDHRTASERYRAERPICEVCLLLDMTRPSVHLHHIKKIVDAPWLRMQRSNWLAVCDEHHELVERDEAMAVRAKAMGDEVYSAAGG